MSQETLRRRLSAMDAFFLYIETEEQPMNVGCVDLFEGKIRFAQFVRNIESRLHLIPRYRQIVMPAPLNLGMPTWEFDPNFDIRNHIKRVKLAAPGSEDRFHELAGELFSGTLSRDKPLWEIYLVEGLAGKRTGMVAKVHHCMIDGIAGVGLMNIIFDAWPNPEKTRKKPYKPAPLPSAAQLLYDALWDGVSESLEHWSKFQKCLAEYGGGKDLKEVLSGVKEFGLTMKDFLSPITRFPFNRPFNGKRIVVGRSFSFAEAREIRSVCGGTVNDVALTIVSGTVQRYLEMHGEPLRKQTVRILVPVNIRQEDERGEMGNRISFLPVDVPLDILDPVERLRIIAETTQHLKESKVIEAISLMFNALQGAPSLLQTLALTNAASSSGQYLLGLMAQVPPSHLICTNVPGPQIPLYSIGHQLLSHYSLLPVALEMGISCAVTSYDQRLYISIITDAQAAPDADRLMEFIADSFHELRVAAEVKERHYVEIPRAFRPAAHAVTRTAAHAATPVPVGRQAVV